MCREQQAKFLGNIELIRLTEQVIFSEPYFKASNNWHTAPHLDDFARLFQTDVKLKAAISRLKAGPPALFYMIDPFLALVLAGQETLDITLYCDSS